MKNRKQLFYFFTAIALFSTILSCKMKPNQNTSHDERYSSTAALKSILISTVDDKLQYKPVSNFDKEKTEIAVDIDAETEEIWLCLIPEDKRISAIKVNKAGEDEIELSKDSDGFYIKNFAVEYGQISTIYITVQAQDETTEMKYSLRITRPLSNGAADLKSIEIALNRNSTQWNAISGFVPYIINYSISFENDWSSIAVSAAASDKNVKSVEMSFDGGAFTKIIAKSGFYTEEYALSVGSHKVQIKVTAANGTVQKIYTINVTRNEKPVAPNPPDEDNKAEYGILIYGCGGGNLDEALVLNMTDAAKFGSNDRVKMAALYKWSEKYQTTPGMNGTFRSVLEGNEWVVKKADSNTVPLYKAETLTSFINWAAVEIPAKHYILIVWNHGDVWDAVDDSPVPLSLPENTGDFLLRPQAAVFDDVLGNRAMSTASLAKGIRDSGQPVKTVYFDVCLMLMMETLQEIKENAPVVEYVMGAEHLTPGVGGNYELLLKTFGSQSGGSHEDRLTSYVKGTVLNPYWWGSSNITTPHDLTAVRMSSFDNTIAKLKDFVDAVDSLPFETKYKAVTQAFLNRYQGFDLDRDDEKSTDLDFFMYLVAGYSGSQDIQSKYTESKAALRASFVVSEKTAHCPLPQVSTGVFTMPFFKNSNDRQVYMDTTFDKAVRWSRLLDLIY